MKRGEPLRRRTPLARGLSELKRSRLNPISEKQRERRRDAAAAVEAGGKAFHAAIRGKRCVVCRRPEEEARAAGTKLQAHHTLAKSRLKRLGLEKTIWDPRLAAPVCEEPCHRRLTLVVVRISRSDLKRDGLWEGLEAYAAEHHVGWLLDREYPEDRSFAA